MLHITACLGNLGGSGQSDWPLAGAHQLWNMLDSGTPVQNSMEELFGILNVLDPNKYDDEEEFLERFGKGMPTLEQVQDLQVGATLSDCRSKSIKVHAIIERMTKNEQELPSSPCHHAMHGMLAASRDTAVLMHCMHMCKCGSQLSRPRELFRELTQKVLLS